MNTFCSGSLFCLAIFISVTYSNKCLSQNDFFQNWKFNVSYFGNNGWNPGLKLGADKVIKEKSLVRESRSKKYYSFREHVVGFNMGTFYDNPTYTSFFMFGDYNHRRIANKGRYLNVGFGLGGFRNFLPETYQVNNGTVSKVRNAGRSYIAPSINTGVGRLWKRSGTRSWFLKAHCFLQLNYNLFPNPLFFVEYGYRFGIQSKEIRDEDID